IPAVVEAIKKTKRQLGSNVGGINLMNKERCLSMLLDYPLDKIKNALPLSDYEIESNAKKLKLTPWLVVGMLYGEKTVTKAAKKTIKENFKHISKRSFFYNSSIHKYLPQIGKFLATYGFKEVPKISRMLSEAYDVLRGTPNNIALRLAYWKHEDKSLLLQDNLNPNRDKCGLIWYAPLVEMKSSEVTRYISFVRDAAKKYNINPLITLTTIDDLCFDSTVPIIFNLQNEQDKNNAREYYHYLLREGAKLGYFPYRLSIESQKEFNIQPSLTTIEPVNKERYK
ncbi:MAG: hypothetical protein K2Q18_15275, partial [Bdellovibrionales bacterium]|nr:hypothetical protein [Bdellovibrionales bacterium]